MASADAAISSMNGFQIGSKILKVQHKRTGYDEDPSGSYGMGSDHNGGGNMGNLGMMSRGNGDRMHGGGGGGGGSHGQGHGRSQSYMQQNQRDNYMSEQSVNDGSNGRFQMTQYGQMQQQMNQNQNQVAYMPVHQSSSSSVSNEDQQSQQQHYSQTNSQHRSLQQLLPNHFLDGVEQRVDTQYNT